MVTTIGLLENRKWPETHQINCYQS